MVAVKELVVLGPSSFELFVGQSHFILSFLDVFRFDYFFFLIKEADKMFRNFFFSMELNEFIKEPTVRVDAGVF